MTIRFKCECGEPLRAPESFAGKKAKCPKCGNVVLVPSPSSVISGLEKARCEIRTGDEVNRQLVDLDMISERAYDQGAAGAILTFEPQFNGWIKYKGAVTCHGCGKPINLQKSAPSGSFGGGDIQCESCGCLLSETVNSKNIDGVSHLFLTFTPSAWERGQVPRRVKVSITEVHPDNQSAVEKPVLDQKSDDQTGIDGEIAKWRNQLESPDGETRETAVCKLADICHPAAIDGLIAALDNSRWQVAAIAARWLGRSGDKRAIEPLLEALKRYPSPTSAVRMAAINALKELGEQHLLSLH